MADNARPPFRADHVGSLLRPKEVLQARDEFAQGEISAEQLAQVEDDAIRDDHPHAGRGRPQVRDRRRAAPPVVAHGLHLPARRHHEGARRHHQGGVPQQGQELRVGAAVGARDRADLAARDDLRRRVHLRPRQRDRGPDRQADHPVAAAWCTTGAAGPRSTRPSTPTSAQFWDDLAAAYAKEIQAAVRPRLPLPAARRHQPGLRQRPGAARARQGDRRRPAAPARDLHRHDQQGAGRPARPT